ncbi:MAG: protein kinase [Planctomycetes bacterium]|nr:protein kinase [Planctomycetota bacterium]
MSELRPPSGAEADALDEIVVLYLDERERGLVSSWDDFARRHPESSTAAARQRVAALEQAGLLELGAAEPELPESLGEFRLLERLGRGGMGLVFRAEQGSVGRSVALKLIRPEQLYYPGARERFRREVEVVAALAHPGIVPVYTFGEDRGLPYYAMELVDGVSLGDILRALAGRSPQSLSGRDLVQGFASPARSELFARDWIAACVEIARQVALALEHAHSRGVLHRDVKPSNVMLSSDGRARLVDFGLAARSGSARITTTGAQLGSVAYMAPEQLDGRPGASDARSDVYALGVTLYELITLRLPFAGEVYERVVQRVREGRPDAPRKLNPALGPDLETVCLTAIDLDPARRYASAAAFAADLENVLALRPIAARPMGALTKARRFAQRNPARAAALALGVLVVVGGPLGYAAVQRTAALEQARLNADLRAANDEIAAQRASLERANLDLGLRQEELAAALERETHARERAQRSAERARRAVDEMLADVGGDELDGVPRAESVRRKLLDKAIALYGELLNDAPDSGDVRRERARTERSIGDLQSDLGLFEDARDYYGRAVASLRELVRDEPGNPEHRHALASVLAMYGNSLNQGGRNSEALAAWGEARTLLEELHEVPEFRARAALDLAPVVLSIGYGHYTQGDNQAALAQYDTAVAYARECVAESPNTQRAYHLLGSALQSRASTLGNLTRPEEAEVAFREAFEMLEKALALDPHQRQTRVEMVDLANNYGLQLLGSPDRERTEATLSLGFETARSLAHDFPDDPELERRLSVVASNYAVHLANSGRFADAAPVLEQASRALEALVARYPERIEYPYYLGATLANLGGIAVELGRPLDAERDSQRGVELLESTLEKTGGHAGVKASLASAYFQRGNARRANGDLAGARAAIARALALDVQRADVLYEGVEILGDCAAQAAELGATDDARALVDETLTLLERAVASGFSDVERLTTEPSLRAVRGEARFAALVERLRGAR